MDGGGIPQKPEGPRTRRECGAYDWTYTMLERENPLETTFCYAPASLQDHELLVVPYGLHFRSPPSDACVGVRRWHEPIQRGTPRAAEGRAQRRWSVSRELVHGGGHVETIQDAIEMWRPVSTVDISVVTHRDGPMFVRDRPPVACVDPTQLGCDSERDAATSSAALYYMPNGTLIPDVHATDGRVMRRVPRCKTCGAQLRVTDAVVVNATGQRVVYSGRYDTGSEPVDTSLRRFPSFLRCSLCKQEKVEASKFSRVLGAMRSIDFAAPAVSTSGRTSYMKTLLSPIRLFEDDLLRDMVLYRIPVDGTSSFGVVHVCLIDLGAPACVLRCVVMAIEAYACRLSPADGIVCIGIGQTTYNSEGHGTGSAKDAAPGKGSPLFGSVMGKADLFAFASASGEIGSGVTTAFASHNAAHGVGNFRSIVTKCGAGVRERIGAALSPLQGVARKPFVMHPAAEGGTSGVGLLEALEAVCDLIEKSQEFVGACHVSAFLARPIAHSVRNMSQIAKRTQAEGHRGAADTPMFAAYTVPTSRQSRPGPSRQLSALAPGDDDAAVHVDDNMDAWCGDEPSERPFHPSKGVYYVASRMRVLPLSFTVFPLSTKSIGVLAIYPILGIAAGGVRCVPCDVVLRMLSDIQCRPFSNYVNESCIGTETVLNMHRVLAGMMVSAAENMQYGAQEVARVRLLISFLMKVLVDRSTIVHSAGDVAADTPQPVDGGQPTQAKSAFSDMRTDEGAAVLPREFFTPERYTGVSVALSIFLKNELLHVNETVTRFAVKARCRTSSLWRPTSVSTSLFPVAPLVSKTDYQEEVDERLLQGAFGRCAESAFEGNGSGNGTIGSDGGADDGDTRDVNDGSGSAGKDLADVILLASLGEEDSCIFTMRFDMENVDKLGTRYETARAQVSVVYTCVRRCTSDGGVRLGASSGHATKHIASPCGVVERCAMIATVVRSFSRSLSSVIQSAVTPCVVDILCRRVTHCLVQRGVTAARQLCVNVLALMGASLRAKGFSPVLSVPFTICPALLACNSVYDVASSKMLPGLPADRVIKGAHQSQQVDGAGGDLPPPAEQDLWSMWGSCSEAGQIRVPDQFVDDLPWVATMMACTSMSVPIHVIHGLLSHPVLQRVGTTNGDFAMHLLTAVPDSHIQALCSVGAFGSQRAVMSVHGVDTGARIAMPIPQHLLLVDTAFRAALNPLEVPLMSSVLQEVEHVCQSHSADRVDDGITSCISLSLVNGSVDAHVFSGLDDEQSQSGRPLGGDTAGCLTVDIAAPGDVVHLPPVVDAIHGLKMMIGWLTGAPAATGDGPCVSVHHLLTTLWSRLVMLQRMRVHDLADDHQEGDADPADMEWQRVPHPVARALLHAAYSVPSVSFSFGRGHVGNRPEACGRRCLHDAAVGVCGSGASRADGHDVASFYSFLRLLEGRCMDLYRAVRSRRSDDGY